MFLHAGVRSKSLMKMAYHEEGLTPPDIDERIKPVRLLYPRSYLQKVRALQAKKIYKYCFMGALYYPNVYEHRKWILSWAAENFTEDCFFQVTVDSDSHQSLGGFDQTNVNQDIFTPKEMDADERNFFHPLFFKIMKNSNFTLCPAGDAPWSMRFFESIMCGSIPIVEQSSHSGRHEYEREIGYNFYLKDDEHVYRPDWVKRNWQLFLARQTFVYNKKKKPNK